MVVMVVLAFVVMVLGKVDIEVATSQAVGGLVGNRVGKAFGGEGRKGGIEFGTVGTRSRRAATVMSPLIPQEPSR